MLQHESGFLVCCKVFVFQKAMYANNRTGMSVQAIDLSTLSISRTVIINEA